MSLAEQLTNIYLREENWHDTKLSKEDAINYHERIIFSGNCITVEDGDFLVGYCEFWRINYEQFGRIICGERFSALTENITNGYIAYVANTFIRVDYRNGKVYKMLRDRFFEANRDCQYFVGEARRKKAGFIKVFNRKDVQSLTEAQHR